MKPHIEVTAHAIDRYRTRSLDDRWGVEIRDDIRNQVQEAIDAGRKANHKPKPFLLYQQKASALEPNEWCVWTQDHALAWIVRRDPDGTLAVVTTLTRAQAAA